MKLRALTAALALLVAPLAACQNSKSATCYPRVTRTGQVIWECR